MIEKKAELKHISSHMPDRTDELLPALRKTKFLLPRSLLFRRQNSSVKSFLDQSKSERKKRREIREDHPLPYPLAIFPAHIFLRRPHNLN